MEAADDCKAFESANLSSVSCHFFVNTRDYGHEINSHQWRFLWNKNSIYSVMNCIFQSEACSKNRKFYLWQCVHIFCSGDILSKANAFVNDSHRLLMSPDFQPVLLSPLMFCRES